MQTRDVKVIEYLKKHERALEELYQLFARTYEEDRAFWADIAEEEQQHAHLLEMLEKKLEHGVDLTPHEFKINAVLISLDYIKQITKRLEAGQLNNLQAAGISLDLEKSLIERRYFAVFSSDSSQIQRVFQTLEEATKHHIERVELFLTSKKIK